MNIQQAEMPELQILIDRSRRANRIAKNRQDKSQHEDGRGNRRQTGKGYQAQEEEGE